MKYIFFTGLLLVACTATKSTLDSSPAFKVGDNFSTGNKFYLGSGRIRVSVVLYGVCGAETKQLQWIYIGSFHKANGDFIEDTEICESELK